MVVQHIVYILKMMAWVSFIVQRFYAKYNTALIQCKKGGAYFVEKKIPLKFCAYQLILINLRHNPIRAFNLNFLINAFFSGYAVIIVTQ